jgi:hypothetical protein
LAKTIYVGPKLQHQQTAPALLPQPKQQQQQTALGGALTELKDGTAQCYFSHCGMLQVAAFCQSHPWSAKEKAWSQSIHIASTSQMHVHTYKSGSIVATWFAGQLAMPHVCTLESLPKQSGSARWENSIFERRQKQPANQLALAQAQTGGQ